MNRNTMYIRWKFVSIGYVKGYDSNIKKQFDVYILHANEIHLSTICPRFICLTFSASKKANAATLYIVGC